MGPGPMKALRQRRRRIDESNTVERPVRRAASVQRSDGRVEWQRGWGGAACECKVDRPITAIL